MIRNQKRLTYYCLASFSFILGCTLTLFVLHAMTLKPNTSPDVHRIRLLVLVLSAVKNQNCRDAIRQTWAQAKENYKIIFVLSRDKLLNAEKVVHNDILEVDILDEYSLLTHKVLESFNDVSDLNFDYLLKCDDDSFVNIPLILNELEHMPQNKFYWGFFNGNANIKTRGKFKETGWVLCDKYLPYAMGGGYILSKDLITHIVKNRDYLSLYASEDISVGTWLAPLNITRKHDRRFDTEWRSRGCCNNHLITHKCSPEMMRQYWTRIIGTGKMCDREFQNFASFEYDWSVKPSKCCMRNLSLIP